MNPATGLAVGRVAVGVAALAAPDLATKVFRLDGRGNPQLPYMTRMFASREIAVGLATVVAKGRARRDLVALGVAVDAADAYAGLEAMRDGSVDRQVGIGLVAPAVLAVGAGIAGLVLGRTRPVAG